MRALRRGVAVAGLSVLTVSGALALTQHSAQAAGVNWYVATAADGGNDATPNCGTTPATPCRTVAFTYAKAAVDDIINVRPGTYPITGAFGAVANANNRLNLTKGMVIRRDPSFAGTVVLDAANVAVANSSIAVVNTPGATLTLREITFQRAVSGFQNSGSALYAFAGTTVLDNVTFDQNRAASGFGGALFVGAGATVQTTGGAFTANSAGAGGAVAVQGANGSTPRGVATFTNTAFTNNTAIGFSAALTGQGGAIYNLGQLTLHGGTVSGSSTTPVAVALSGSGGGIYSTGTLAINGTTVSGNTARGIASAGASGLGGGIFQNAPGTAAITGATISGNAATVTGAGTAGTFSALGGGVFNGGAGSTITGSTISSNTVTGSTPATTGVGGGLWNQGALTLNDTDVTANTAAGSAAASTGRGGGAFNGNGPASLTVTNGSSVSGNQALAGAGANSGQGGGIWNEATLVVDASSVSSNTASGAGSAGAAVGRGGGIHTSNLATANATVRNGSTVSGNTASGGTAGSTGVGGGIDNGRVLTVTDSSVNDNTATGATAGSGIGGGIASALSLTATRAVLSGNDAVGGAATNSGRGGGIINAFGTAAITDTTVTSGSAAGTGSGAGHGGGVDNFAGVMTLTGGSVTGNSAVIGGGISNLIAPGVGSLTVNGTLVSGNTAVAGGGLYTTGAGNVVGVTDADISDNEALSGGGIWNSSSTVEALRTRLDGNTATATAANTGLGGGLLNSGTATFTEGSISSNSATASAAAVTGLGGGAFNTGALTVRGTDVQSNTATGSGGFQTGWGGGFYNGGNGDNTSATLVIERSTLASNTAVVGSALIGYVPGAGSTSKASIRRSTVHANVATVVGGGWYIGSTGASLSVVESTVAGNSSGLAQNANSTANVSGSIMFGNGPNACGVANSATVVDGGHNLARPGDTSCFPVGNGNVFADPQLGALADNGGPTLTMLPSASSPALDRIPGNQGTAVNDAVSGSPVVLCDIGDTDQRGVVVPQGTLCDIGSVEREQAAPVVTNAPDATFVVGTAGEATGYTASGSPSPTFSATGLPTGLSIQSTGPGTAKIVGTPAAGTAGVHNVTITATNEAGSGSDEIVVTVNQAPGISGPTTLNLMETIDGAAANYSSTGFPTPTIAHTGGALPPGVTFVAGPGGTATIDGAPAVGSAGTYNVTLTASNGTLPNATLNVTINVVPLITITTTSLPDGQHGVAYSQTLTAIGGNPPYTWSIDSGTLPAGLSLNPSTGVVSGVPSGAPGTSSFTVRAVDSSDPQQSDTQALSITIGKGPTVVTVSKVLISTGPLGVRLGVVDANLRGGLPLQPIPGQTITFKAGATTVCTAVTDANGNAGCAIGPANTLLVILNGGVTATYAGNTFWLPSSGSAGLL